MRENMASYAGPRWKDDENTADISKHSAVDPYHAVLKIIDKLLQYQLMNLASQLMLTCHI